LAQKKLVTIATEVMFTDFHAVYASGLFPWLEKELMVSTFMTASSLQCLLCLLYYYITWFATKCTAWWGSM